MKPPVLSELRLLSSAELDSRWLPTIILAGDGRLAHRLEERDLLPIASRVRSRQRLSQTVQDLRPILLILDPLIRLHRVDENDATQIAYLRELQRQFHLAVLVVHHARKDSHSSRPGQALRGSRELHG